MGRIRPEDSMIGLRVLRWKEMISEGSERWDSFMKESSLRREYIESIVHIPLLSASTVLASCCRMGIYSGYVARLYKTAVTIWLVVWIETAPILNWLMAWKR